MWLAVLSGKLESNWEATQLVILALVGSYLYAWRHIRLLQSFHAAVLTFKAAMPLLLGLCSGCQVLLLLSSYIL